VLRNAGIFGPNLSEPRTLFSSFQQATRLPGSSRLCRHCRSQDDAKLRLSNCPQAQEFLDRATFENLLTSCDNPKEMIHSQPAQSAARASSVCCPKSSSAPSLHNLCLTYNTVNEAACSTAPCRNHRDHRRNHNPKDLVLRFLSTLPP
jgi:hypothetical protein